MTPSSICSALFPLEIDHKRQVENRAKTLYHFFVRERSDRENGVESAKTPQKKREKKIHWINLGDKASGASSPKYD